ncbi:MAG: PIG-L family deacetylase [Lachnospiraceae bacterium]|nr:PIG-L family deacetylase [Lachnospiraceae bacterium]
MRKTAFQFFICALVLSAALLLHQFPMGSTALRVQAAPQEAAEELTLTVRAGDNNAPQLTDNNYNSIVRVPGGQTLTVSAEKPIAGLYIEWADPGEHALWTLSANGQSYTGGSNDFLHEYAQMPGGSAAECTLTLEEERAIANIHGYTEGELPPDVQVWEPPLARADFLALVTHPDDELLYLGGVIATYAGEQKLRVQVAHMVNFRVDEPIREHEKLDGLWVLGVHAYPVTFPFEKDVYSESLAQAEKQYDRDAVTACVTEAIRRFQPLVLVTQDFNGEYGHGAHMLLAHAVADALEEAPDAAARPESATQYGVYDVPKAYFHLYAENKIYLDMRAPLSFADGQNALEIVTYAFKKHVSQEYTKYYVSDDVAQKHRNIADFGLYRTLVGTDTTADMTEHITTYGEQERIALEEAEAREAELRRQEEEKAKEEALAAQHALEKEEAEAVIREEEEIRQSTGRTGLIIGITVGVLVLIIPLVISNTVRWSDAKKRRSRRNRQRRK